MSRSIERRAQFAVDLAERVEAWTLARVRGYLGRGRPLAGLPPEALRAEWIEAHLEVHALDRRSRADGLRDLGTEHDLRGLAPPLAEAAAEVARFKERFRKELHDRPTDPAAVERLEAALAAAAERLIGYSRAVPPPWRDRS